MPAHPQNVVFLLDVDNTLLDNDAFSSDLDARLERDFGVDERVRYRELYSALRDERGYADYLGAVQRFREGAGNDPALLKLAEFILDYPFADRLFPRALDAISHLSSVGRPAILSDGDIVLQPRKVRRSGLWEALDGRVAITLNKERCVDQVKQRWPARHYVMVEDKPKLLAALKQQLGTGMTTVFVRQGHYAQEQQLEPSDPRPDIVIDRIAELCSLDLGDFEAAASSPFSGSQEQQ